MKTTIGGSPIEGVTLELIDSVREDFDTGVTGAKGAYGNVTILVSVPPGITVRP